MGHYDWRSDTFTTEETQDQILKTGDLVSMFKNRKEQINSDSAQVKQEYTIRILKDEVSKLETNIEKYTKELNGWKKVLERIQNGESISWEQAHNIAESRF